MLGCLGVGADPVAAAVHNSVWVLFYSRDVVVFRRSESCSISPQERFSTPAMKIKPFT